MDNIKELAKAVAHYIKGESAKTKPYDTAAKVKRIENGKAYVEIPGGVPETPVKLTIDAKRGDTVQVHVANGTAWLVGNSTAPPTDDAEALKAKTVAVAAQQTADDAEETAEQAGVQASSALTQAQAAKQIADNTEQHFWFQETGADTGAHITEVTQEEWSDAGDPNYHSGGNFLGRANGIALRDGMSELATLQQSGMDINSYDGGGNTVNIAHLGYGAGTDSGGGTSNAPFYTLGTRAAGAIGNYSVAEGYNVNASGYSSHTEGGGTIASGMFSHAEGASTQATGVDSHSEGYNTLARNGSSHAEGYGTEASKDGAHAGGYFTKALYLGQTAIGKYNDNKSGDLFEIGNGTADNARSNAFEVDTSGNIDIPTGAKYKINGTALAPSDLGEADYVIEKGKKTTSGTWYYEKWASGKIEAWGENSTGTLTMSASGSMYRATNVSVAMASGIFTSTPTYVEAFASYSSAVFVNATATATSTTNLSCLIWKSTNATASVDLKFHVVYYPSNYA